MKSAFYNICAPLLFFSCVLVARLLLRCSRSSRFLVALPTFAPPSRRDFLDGHIFIYFHVLLTVFSNEICQHLLSPFYFIFADILICLFHQSPVLQEWSRHSSTRRRPSWGERWPGRRPRSPRSAAEERGCTCFMRVCRGNPR